MKALRLPAKNPPVAVILAASNPEEWEAVAEGGVTLMLQCYVGRCPLGGSVAGPGVLYRLLRLVPVL